MEVENMRCSKIITNTNNKEEDDDVQLPGFRFHPTDEELVGFYLKRKVEKKPISIELIKQADIYKYDPWDLPKSTNIVGDKDKEWYFFCKRGRKYKNSVRPNRVTASGFWKATGIDRPIYSSGGRDCIIGLKKSLVYYRGSAGKGTKTDWMMHEFRLPASHDKSTKHMDVQTIAQEAEVWTLCRILKRNVPYRKCVPDWRDVKKTNVINPLIDASSETCSVESSHEQNAQSSYISFSAPITVKQNDKNLYSSGHLESVTNQHDFSGQFSLTPQAPNEVSAFSSNIVYGDINEFLRRADWEDLRSIVECAGVTANYYPMY